MTNAVAKSRAFEVVNLGPLIGGSKGSIRFHKKTPLFFSPPLNSYSGPTPSSSIIYSYNILSSREQNMPQLFNNNSNSFNTNNSFNTTYINPTVADDRPNILAWLSPLEPKLRHQGIQDGRVETIGEWVLQTEEFRSWYAGSSEGGKYDNAVLFCYGNPGVGKTYIR